MIVAVQTGGSPKIYPILARLFSLTLYSVTVVAVSSDVLSNCNGAND